MRPSREMAPANALRTTTCGRPPLAGTAQNRFAILGGRHVVDRRPSCDQNGALQSNAAAVTGTGRKAADRAENLQRPVHVGRVGDRVPSGDQAGKPWYAGAVVSGVNRGTRDTQPEALDQIAAATAATATSAAAPTAARRHTRGRAGCAPASRDIASLKRSRSVRRSRCRSAVVP